MISSPVNEPFADWLDLTFPPECGALGEVHTFFDGLLCPVAWTSDDRTCIEAEGGKVFLDRAKRFHRLSISGGVLHFLRSVGRFSELLGVLGSHPHKVTRLDVACDYGVDTPAVLGWLDSVYPEDRVCLQRKAIKVTRLLSRRADGALTGTWYAGHRSNARVTARVYDKQHEALEKRGERIAPRTRVELTFRKDHGCTLRDAYMPASLFYQFASPTLVAAPEGVPEWVPHGEGWEGTARAPELPYEVFKRRVETSPELDRLAELASQFGPNARALLLRAFADRLDSAARSSLKTGTDS